METCKLHCSSLSESSVTAVLISERLQAACTKLSSIYCHQCTYFCGRNSKYGNKISIDFICFVSMLGLWGPKHAKSSILSLSTLLFILLAHLARLTLFTAGMLYKLLTYLLTC